MTKKILMTGGGSGGHLNTAIATLKYLQKEQPEIFQNIVYVGGRLGMINDKGGSLEEKLIPPLGVKFLTIRSGKLHRVLSIYTFTLLFGVFGGLIDAFKIVRKERPDLVFSTGGYVTVPIVIAAHFAKIPVIIHEQTIVSGLANRIAAKFAKKILVTFPESVHNFPAAKTIVTGNALQEDRFLNELPDDLDPGYRFKLQNLISQNGELPLIYLTGGGLGSHKLNQWVIQNLAVLLRKYRMIVQTGEYQDSHDYKELISQVSELDSATQSRILVVKWIRSEIGYILTNATVVVSRAGANTILELLARNKKTVLVPIPWSAGQEQQKNAEYFLKLQSGRIVAEANLMAELTHSVTEVIQLPVKDSAAAVKRDAVATIVNELLN